MKTRKPPFSRKVDADAATAGWDKAAGTHAGTVINRLTAEKKLREAQDAERASELALAKQGLASWKAGFVHAGVWLVWWYNNGETSTRGNRPCVTEASSIPGECYPA